MRKLLSLLALFLCASLLYGCFDFRGLSEQTIISGLAVDASEDGIELTFEIVDVAGVENGQFGAVVFTTTGETFEAALQDAREALPGEVYLATMRVLILSSHGLEAETLPLVTHLIHDRGVRNSLPLVMAEGERASALLTPSDEPDAPPMIRATVLIKSLRDGEADTNATLHQVYSALLTDGASIKLPIIALTDAEAVPFEYVGTAEIQDEGRG